MKFTDKIALLGGTPFYSIELFPPGTPEGFDLLISQIPNWAQLNPTSISVTWGAGGASSNGSLELATATQTYGLDTEMHLTCTNLTTKRADHVLKLAKARGIENIFALRGDPPEGQEQWTPTDPNFVHAIDLVKYIRRSPEFSSHFSIRVGAYPDRYPNTTETLDQELHHLKQKVDAGADYIVTQLFFDVDRFLSWQAKVRAKGITVPIIPGIIPIRSCSSLERIAELAGAYIPPSLNESLKGICDDAEKVEDFGVQYAIHMIKRLIHEGSVPGIYFSPLNVEASVQRVLEGLGWAKPNELLASNWTNPKPVNAVEEEVLSPHVMRVKA